MNIEAEVISHLSNALQIPVYAQPIDPRPEVFATVERTGGTSMFFIDYPLLTIQWWAATVEDASELQKTGNAALWAMVNSSDYPAICNVVIESTPRYIDPESGQARYQTQAQFTVQIL